MSTATKKKEDAAAAAAAASDGGDASGGKKKKLLLVVLVLVVVAGAAVWFLFLRGAGAAEAEPERVPGDVVAMEPISINLADGHYLRIGIALQAVEGGHGAPEGSKALDLTIAAFSGRSTAELADPAVREEIKKHLVEKLDEAYHHEVMDVYFTEFVTQ